MLPLIFSVSAGLVALACSSEDGTGSKAEPGDAGPPPREAGIPDRYHVNEYDFIDNSRVLTPEMMCGSPDAGPALPNNFTHNCIWSTRRITNNPGRIDRDPALVATGNPTAPVGLSWTGDEQIFLRILDGKGATIGNEVQVSNAVAAGNSRVAYDGSNFGIVWDDRSDPTRIVPVKVEFRLADTQQVPGTATNLVDAGSRADKPALTAIDTGWVTVWGDGRPGAVGLYGSVLTPQGTISLGEQALTLSAKGAILPSVVWTGSDLAVAWHDNRDGNSAIYFGRFDTSLQPIESSSQAITPQDRSASEPTVINIINTDGGFAISWLDTLCGSVRVHLTMLDSEGRWLIPEQIFTRGNASAASVAWDADHGLLGLLWFLGDAAGRELQFQLLDTKANRISEVTTLASDVLSSSEDPQLIWTPDGFMTAFENAPANDREIFVATGACTEN